MATLTGISPLLLVGDLDRAVAFYRDRLGFECELYGEPPNFAVVQRDAAVILLALAPDPAQIVPNWRIVDKTCNAYIRVDDADAVYAEVQERGAGDRLRDLRHALGVSRVRRPGSRRPRHRLRAAADPAAGLGLGLGGAGVDRRAELLHQAEIVSVVPELGRPSPPSNRKMFAAENADRAGPSARVSPMGRGSCPTRSSDRRRTRRRRSGAGSRSGGRERQPGSPRRSSSVPQARERFGRPEVVAHIVLGEHVVGGVEVALHPDLLVEPADQRLVSAAPERAQILSRARARGTSHPGPGCAGTRLSRGSRAIRRAAARPPSSAACRGASARTRAHGRRRSQLPRAGARAPCRALSAARRAASSRTCARRCGAARHIRPPRAARARRTRAGRRSPTRNPGTRGRRRASPRTREAGRARSPCRRAPLDESRPLLTGRAS